jgi:hypothetical protein
VREKPHKDKEIIYTNQLSSIFAKLKNEKYKPATE